jgi:hypothetical protein
MSMQPRGLLASFEYLDSTLDAIKTLRQERIRKFTVYSPLPEHHLEAAMGYGQSPVRVFALVGGLTGAAAGFAFTSFTSMEWPLVTGGKPILSIPAYVVIAFELTILFGALATVIGLFLLSRLPHLGPLLIYDPEFTAGRFGIHVFASPEELEKARRILEEHHPAEVREDREGVGRA